MSNYNEAQEVFDAALAEMDAQVVNLTSKLLGKEVSQPSVSERDNVLTGTISFDGEHHHVELSFFDTYNAKLKVLGGQEYCGFEPQLVVALQDAYTEVSNASDEL